jgi:D-alanyl-D-alanine dipeptidase
MKNHNLDQRKILSFRDVLVANTSENNEELVDARKFAPKILAIHENQEMQKYTGNQILVRKTVAKKLAIANQKLPKPFRLKIVFGYRHPDIQRKYFETELKKAIEKYGHLETDKLYEKVHPLIAVPEVAGHPTGGAVDVTITDKTNQDLPMGTKISDFSNTKLLPTFSNGLSQNIQLNRKILHDAMISAGFAPFYGEWWHFSYGDREWAAFYGKSHSIYSEIHL